MPASNTIGGRIRALREARGETQAELANALHVKRETVNQWENGSRDLKTQYTISIADHFDITCDQILRGIKAENISINKSIGLSENAIEALKAIKRYATVESKYGTIATVQIEGGAPEEISQIIAHKNLLGIAAMLNTLKNIRRIEAKSNRQKELLKLMTLVEFRDFTLQRCLRLFSDIVDDIAPYEFQDGDNIRQATLADYDDF